MKLENWASKCEVTFHLLKLKKENEESFFRFYAKKRWLNKDCISIKILKTCCKITENKSMFYVAVEYLIIVL